MSAHLPSPKFCTPSSRARTSTVDQPWPLSPFSMSFINLGMLSFLFCSLVLSSSSSSSLASSLVRFRFPPLFVLDFAVFFCDFFAAAFCVFFTGSFLFRPGVFRFHISMSTSPLLELRVTRFLDFDSTWVGASFLFRLLAVDAAFLGGFLAFAACCFRGREFGFCFCWFRADLVRPFTGVSVAAEAFLPRVGGGALLFSLELFRVPTSSCFLFLPVVTAVL
mmetsp:Transcript_17834/g.43640  ORF Transcript_17834/g.43640 Transcript_17834/m.43640 type:complete len:221 (-) Transcript_17834:236-898(-)